MSRKAIRAVFEEYEKKRASADQALRDKLITPEGHRRELEGWARQHKWHERMAEIESNYERRLDQAQQKAAQIRQNFTKAPAGNATEQLLFEVRAQRQWARAQRLLDQADDVKAIGIASTMIREAEGHDAVALAQELGAYLEARNLPRDGIAKEFDAKIPGLAEVNAEIETANEEYLQVHSAASAVRGVMEGKQGRHFVDIMAPAETNETAGE
ncbi:hypothetical protein [Rhodococcus sp. 2G]|uniref:hypothetical protein n=1 Tax=Rhodococcus sp. 2G TaxID=1570939 RepID=UPI000A56AF5D|nr:hypothetical protein [Rhodococcus sp. 2G]